MSTALRERGKSLADVRQLASKEHQFQILLPLLEQLDRNLNHVMKRVFVCEDRLDSHSSRLKDCLTKSRRLEEAGARRHSGPKPKDVRCQAADQMIPEVEEELRVATEDVGLSGVDAVKTLGSGETSSRNREDAIRRIGSGDAILHTWEKLRRKVLDKEVRPSQEKRKSQQPEEQNVVEKSTSLPHGQPDLQSSVHLKDCPLVLQARKEEVIRRPLSAEGRPALSQAKRQALEALRSSPPSGTDAPVSDIMRAAARGSDVAQVPFFSTAADSSAMQPKLMRAAAVGMDAVQVPDTMRAAEVPSSTATCSSRRFSMTPSVERTPGDLSSVASWETARLERMPVSWSRSRSLGDLSEPLGPPAPPERDKRNFNSELDEEQAAHVLGLKPSSGDGGHDSYHSAYRVSPGQATGLEDLGSSVAGSEGTEPVTMAHLDQRPGTPLTNKTLSWVEDAGPAPCCDVWKLGCLDDEKNFRELFASTDGRLLRDTSMEEDDVSLNVMDDFTSGMVPLGSDKLRPRTRILEFESGDAGIRSSRRYDSQRDDSEVEVVRETIIVESAHAPPGSSRFARGSVRQSFASVGNILSDLRHIVQGEILGAHPAVKEIYRKAHTVQLKDSVWDVTLFIFYRPLGRGTNMSVVIPLLLTIFLQVSFLCVVVVCIVRKEDTPGSLITDFSEWRHLSDLAVQQAVCNKDASLSTSFMQASTFDTFDSYSEELLEGHRILAGPFTSWIVCSAWVLTILKEVGGVLDKSLGVLQCTRLKCKVLELQVFQTAISSGFKVLSLPPHRCAWFFAICLIQSVIALSLLIAGLEWLVATTEIVDLLLNGVALSYIMDLDELIYNVFIPTKLSTLIHLLDPLPARWDCTLPLRGIFLFFVGVAGLVGTSYLIWGHLEATTAVRDALCPHEFPLA